MEIIKSEPGLQVGDRRALPTEVAEKLIESGVAKDIGPFPPEDMAPVVQERIADPPRRILQIGRKLRR